MKKQNNQKNVNIKMSQEMHDKIKKISKENGLTTSGMIKYLISQEINKKGY